MTPVQQQKAAKAFAEFWQGKGNEKSDAQAFWFSLLRQVFGMENPEQDVEVEKPVPLDHTSFIDVYIPATKVLIEQKSIDKDLSKGYKQSDDKILTPYQQAKRYANELPRREYPRWIVVCNFAEFWVYDLERPHEEPQKILLANLENEYERLNFLVDQGDEHIKQEQKVSEDAGRLVGQIYDALLAQYHEPENPETLRSLNILCVRLVFCLYAEDAHLFGKKTAFHDYLAQYPAKDIRRALLDLFDVLDTHEDQRDPYMDDALKAFPYVNGGLFSNDTRLIVPQFTEELKTLILSKASDNFDWSEISPTIFGAIFESTLNPETRRSGGMHYTSIANIHKVIDPLFLNDLKKEFEAIKAISQERQQRQKLDAFQDKLASLNFFDPACGSGNFLTESYVSLRRLENEVISFREKGQGTLGDIANPIKVDIHQFYGIEINDFAVSVATTALWIAEQQMLQETQKLVSFNVKPLPLKAYHNIHEGNALRTDWSEVITPEKLDYIMGNPPFVGYSLQSKEQKEDMLSIYVDEKGKPYKTAGKIDYVAAWYWKAAELMQKASSIVPDTIRRTPIRAALVSTNSITQGEQVAAIWKPLFDRFNIHIDFAYRTFRWDSEADIKAHVHCVIIGFSCSALGGIPSSTPSSISPELYSGSPSSVSPALDAGKSLSAASGVSSKRIYLSNAQSVSANNINPYLMDAPNIWVENRTKPLCNVPELQNGGKPVEGGFLILTKEEHDELLAKEPQAQPLFRPYMMGKDFIERKPRYCLWLVDANPSLLRQCHEVMQRIKAVREYRLQSPKEATRRCAETPALFAEVRECTTDYVAIPKVSSENRRYIPMEYLDKSIIPGDKLFMMQGASLYHFGVLTSNVHMAWMRVVCGRLEMRYSYSNTIVYNNFPWCQPTEEQKAKIEQTAQAILDARAKYPDSSLADLYDENAMPIELPNAHRENDRAVMAAYGFSTKMTESECVAELFKMYQSLTK